ncbi:MAG: hypothetical protein WA581_15345 [Candidatus Acidiferrales bacterium]
MRPTLGPGLVMRALSGRRLGLSPATADDGGERLPEFLLPLILQEKPEASVAKT